MEPAAAPPGDPEANQAGDSETTGGGSDGGAGGTQPDPFAALKTIDVLGAVRIRVPEIWPSAWDEKAGMWCCCEDLEDPAEDTGTFWIDFNLVDLGPDAPAPGSPESAQALDSMAQGIALEKMLTEDTGDDEPALRVTPGGQVITYSRRFESGTQKLIEYRWHMLTLVERGLAVAHCSLILTEETADRPAWKRLVATMDREVQAAALRRPGRRPAPE